MSILAHIRVRKGKLYSVENLVERFSKRTVGLPIICLVKELLVNLCDSILGVAIVGAASLCLVSETKHRRNLKRSNSCELRAPPTPPAMRNRTSPKYKLAHRQMSLTIRKLSKANHSRETTLE